MKSSLGASSTLLYFNNLQDASADLDVVVYTKRTIQILLFAHQKTPLEQRTFNRELLQIIHPLVSILYLFMTPKWIWLFTTLRLGLCHFCDHKLRHSFHENIYPIYRCKPHATIFYTAPSTKMKTDPSNGTNKAILGEDDSKTKEVLLYGKIYLIRTRAVQ